MEQISIKKFESEEKFWPEVAGAISKELSNCMRERRELRIGAGMDVSEATGLAYLGVSGGKTPQPLYQLLRDDKKLDWSKIDVFLVDERKVNRDLDSSNSKMIRENLYGGDEDRNLLFFHDFVTELPKSEALELYEEEYTLVEKGELDLVILGVGPDGHFASVFPGFLEKSAEADEEGRIALSTTTDQFEVNERLSMTAEIIAAAKKIIIVIKGKDKLAVLEEMENGSKTSEEFPIKYLLGKMNKENLQIYYCN